METHKITTYIIGVGLFLASCAKDDLYNTPHPDKGAVRVMTDWTDVSADAVLPQSYTLRIGTQEQTVSGTDNAFNALFEPGKQDLLVYHPADGIATSITSSGTTATVNTREDGTLEPLPGYLFSASQSLEIVKDDTLQVSVKMQQHIRSLTLALKLNPGDEQRIVGTSATLTGIASAIDLRDGTITATGGKTVIPTFVLGTDEAQPQSANGGQQHRVSSQTRAAGQPTLSTILRLLGVMTGERQLLTLAITLTDGTVQAIVTDLTELLKNFGTSMEPLELDATLQLPAEAGFTATIGNWTEVDNGEIKVN